tara:strand:- start:43 stop:390 length:348 start_codon:yes stop_codon:yes gene_type:complete
MDKNCLFCKIINNEIPATIIDENSYSLAFKDINPQANIHILIIPKIHISCINELKINNIQYLSNMFLLSKKITKNINVQNSGYRLIINTGKDGGQTVDHLHLHLLAGKKLNWPPE